MGHHAVIDGQHDWAGTSHGALARLQFDEGARQIGLHHLLRRAGLVLALPLVVPQFTTGGEDGELPIGPDLVHKGPIRAAARLVDVAQVRPDAEVIHHG